MKNLNAAVDRIEGDMAVLKFYDLSLNVPVKYLPVNAKEGEILNVSIARKDEYMIEKKRKAKEILNEILKK